MSNSAILTYQSGPFSVSKTYYTPSVIIPTTGELLGSIYCLLAKVEQWTDEMNPPTPSQTQFELKKFFKNAFVAKTITTADMCPVIERKNWKNNTVYDYYRDDVEMFSEDANGFLTKKFYVRNKYDQVFKCLWNNNGGNSTIEPYFEPGTFNAAQIFQGADGYKWKFMYSISAGLKMKFMDETWIPVPINTNFPNPETSDKGIGGIEVINVTNGGSGYDTSNAFVSVNVTGDGIGASANAVVSGGVVTDIVIYTPGSDYSFANVSIESNQGSGAIAIAPASPVGGHGTDPISELGCKRVMLTCRFEKGESGDIPTDIDFRQIGLVVNPYAYQGTSIGLANNNIYRLTKDVIVSSGFGSFVEDEIVFQAPDSLYENKTFSGTIVSFDTSTNEARVINTEGTITPGGILVGVTSGTTRVVIQSNSPEFITHSGYLIYIENRAAIRRNPDGSEQFRLVLSY